jgi:two-component system invasion response regulator UvrY
MTDPPLAPSRIATTWMLAAARVQQSPHSPHESTCRLRRLNPPPCDTARVRAARVLLVDDQASFRRAARRVLERFSGFEVAGEVVTGEAAVEAALALSPDLVLMDVHLPGINGPVATRRILDAAVDAPPVIMLLSTYDAADFSSLAVTCGASAYLPKADFSAATLGAAWSAAIASRPDSSG